MNPVITESALGAFIVVLLRCGAIAMTAPVMGDGGVPVRAQARAVYLVAIAIAANHPGVAFVDLPRTAPWSRVGRHPGLTASFVLARVAVAGQIDGPRARARFRVGVRPARRRIRRRDPHDRDVARRAGVSRGEWPRALVRGVATPTSAIAVGTGCLELLRVGAAAFGHGLALAAPVMLAALVANVGLAVMNRAAPALNVFAVALSTVLALGAIDVARDEQLRSSRASRKPPVKRPQALAPSAASMTPTAAREAP